MAAASNINNYAQLVNKILSTAVKYPTVNYAFSGNVYEINSMELTQYPVMVVSAIRPAIERENYFEFYLTLMYIDRLQEETEEQQNADSVIIESNGISTLSKVINEIRQDPAIVDLPFGNQYTIYSRTFCFNDYCQAVSTEITVIVQKSSIC